MIEYGHMQKLKFQFRLLFVIITFMIPFCSVYAHGNCPCEEYKFIKPSQKVHKQKTHPKKTKVKKHKRQKSHQKYRGIQKGKRLTVIEEFPPVYHGDTKSSQTSKKIFRKCRELPTGVVQCYTINQRISSILRAMILQKIEGCEAYTCKRLMHKIHH